MIIVRVIRDSGEAIASYPCKNHYQALKQLLLQYHAVCHAAKLPFEPVCEDLFQATLELLPRGESVTWNAPGAKITAEVADDAEFAKHESKRKFVAAKKAVSRLH